ncbi:MAG TPA: hypothetical protein PKH58_01375 [Paludibacteraceae bacterium]|nr:hypothetical protein [Paludibacteraceae bacterium]
MTTDTFVIDNITIMPGLAAIITESDSQDLIEDPTNTISIGENDKIAPWGRDNDLPDKVFAKIMKSDVAASNLMFNIQACYGQGIKPMMRRIENNTVAYQECNDEKVMQFFDDNDINGYFHEQCTDFITFFNAFPEIVLTADGRSVYSLRHKEAMFSRLGVVNNKGEIVKHYYSSKWNSESGSANKENTVISEVLSHYNPYADLTARITKGNRTRRFIMPVRFPVPGHIYYPKPYFWSMFRSGSYDFSSLIWKYKKTLLKNGLAVRYIIYIDEKYWQIIFDEEKIDRNDPKKVKDRKEEEFAKFRNFLTDEHNQGKGLMALKKTIQTGTGAIVEKYIEIEEVKITSKGGEFIEDSSEVNNVMSYAMGVHPNMIGANPGKTGQSMSGTDKRELYMIKTAMMKPFRDRLLQPLYLVKRYNKWPNELEFVVTDYQFPTLDQNKTGKQEVAQS